MTIRVAVTEVSHWHAFHAPSYVRQLARMSDVEIVALQDPDRGLAASRAAEMGVAGVYDDYRAMLRETRPDFVLALGRHSVMAEIAHHLLDEGYPFLMEKPMGLNAREVGSIMEKVKKKGGFAAVPLPQRQMPFFTKARALIDQGRFGPLSHIYIRINRESSSRYHLWNSSWMLDPAVSGGGCLRNLGIHGFDFFLQLAGGDARVTGAQISNRALGEKVEDFATVLLHSSNGIVGTVEVGNVYPGMSGNAPPKRLFAGGDVEWKIVGRDALLSSKDGTVRLVTHDSDDREPEQAVLSHPSYRLIRGVFERFVAGQPPETGVQDCFRAVRLIDDAYAMADSSPPSPIP